MSLRCGITTGTCAAAAAKAAAICLAGGAPPAEVAVTLPGGEVRRVPVLVAHAADRRAAAVVIKDAGDDPDVTHGLEIHAELAWSDAAGVSLAAGEGVGTVTKPGLQVPPGRPAINPVPRQMIEWAVREIIEPAGHPDAVGPSVGATAGLPSSAKDTVGQANRGTHQSTAGGARAGQQGCRGVQVEIRIPGGRQVARKTFNPRLGIVGGLSILGTTGIVRPHCAKALCDALDCALAVAAACPAPAVVCVPGHIGARAARRRFALRPEQIVEVGNAWGFLLDRLAGHALRAVLVLGHPGKLAKLAQRQWDTHSARSGPATRYLAGLCQELLGHASPDCPTSEGLLAAMPAGERTLLAEGLARRIRQAVTERLGGRLPVAVMLVDMAGGQLGADGDFSPWQ
ncbi:MAG: cobalt-precorrin-5B (C(1))-methyltransferase [Thermoguttaceae bacterium]